MHSGIYQRDSNVVGFNVLVRSAAEVDTA
jgi:hypothetical protein